MNLKSIAVVLFFSSCLSNQVFAQESTVPSDSGVTAACLSADSGSAGCEAAIEAYLTELSALGLAPAEMDMQLAALSATLAEGSQVGANPAIVAAALRQVSTRIQNPDQRSVVASLAESVAANEDLPVAAVGTATPASPN